MDQSRRLFRQRTCRTSIRIEASFEACSRVVCLQLCHDAGVQASVTECNRDKQPNLQNTHPWNANGKRGIACSSAEPDSGESLQSCDGGSCWLRRSLDHLLLSLLSSRLRFRRTTWGVWRAEVGCNNVRQDHPLPVISFAS